MPKKVSSSTRTRRRAQPVIWMYQPTHIRWVRGRKKLEEWQRRLEKHVGMGVLQLNPEVLKGRKMVGNPRRRVVIAASCAETWCGGKPNGAPDDCGYD